MVAGGYYGNNEVAVLIKFSFSIFCWKCSFNMLNGSCFSASAVKKIAPIKGD